MEIQDWTNREEKVCNIHTTLEMVCGAKDEKYKQTLFLKKFLENQ